MHSAEDIENIVVKNTGKRIILVKDVATVNVKEAVEYTRINANGREALLIAVIKQPNANLVDISKAMETKVEELKKVLPRGVTIRPYYLQADFVNDAVRSVTDSLWIGLALAIFVAIIFLRSLKASTTILIHYPDHPLSHADRIVRGRLYLQYHDPGCDRRRHRPDHRRRHRGSGADPPDT